MKLSLIVAMSRNGVIGKDGGLPWGRIPEDMRLFRELTMGRPVIMGRKTWESLADRPDEIRGRLPGRMNIILSRTLQAKHWPDIFVRRSLFPAVRLAIQHDFKRAAVIGGAEIYAEVKDSYWVDSAHVTLIDRDCDGDTVFPFPILDSPDWAPLAEPRELAPGVVYHHLGRVAKS